MRIKAIILDFGGTLSDGGLDRESYHEELRNILLRRGYSVAMDDLKKALRGSLEKLNRLRSKGKEMTFEEVYEIFLGKLDIPVDNETLNELHNNFKKHYKTEYFHCTKDVLIWLSQRYKVGLISNTMSDQPRCLLEESGYEKYFDLILCSRDLGIRKPNPLIFKHVLGKLGVKSDEAIHVGDSIEADMYGAQEAGITGIWIKSPNQPPWSGYAIKSICDLPDLIIKMESG